MNTKRKKKKMGKCDSEKYALIFCFVGLVLLAQQGSVLSVFFFSFLCFCCLLFIVCLLFNV